MRNNSENKLIIETLIDSAERVNYNKSELRDRPSPATKNQSAEKFPIFCSTIVRRTTRAVKTWSWWPNKQEPKNCYNDPWSLSSCLRTVLWDRGPVKRSTPKLRQDPKTWLKTKARKNPKFIETENRTKVRC